MNLTFPLGIVGPNQLIVIAIIYLLITIVSLILILKNEKNLSLFFWILLLLFVPFIGSIIYLLKNFTQKRVIKT